MRFGSFVFPVSHNPGGDGGVIDGTLREIELADAVGLHAVWLTEHHFDGAVAYADPLVMGAAVAARTRQIRLGSRWWNWRCIIPFGLRRRRRCWITLATAG